MKALMVSALLSLITVAAHGFESSEPPRAAVQDGVERRRAQAGTRDEVRKRFVRNRNEILARVRADLAAKRYDAVIATANTYAAVHDVELDRLRWQAERARAEAELARTRAEAARKEAERRAKDRAAGTRHAARQTDTLTGWIVGADWFQPDEDHGGWMYVAEAKNMTSSPEAAGDSIWIVSVSRALRTRFREQLDGGALIGKAVRCRGTITGETKQEPDFAGATCRRLRYATFELTGLAISAETVGRIRDHRTRFGAGEARARELALDREAVVRHGRYEDTIEGWVIGADWHRADRDHCGWLYVSERKVAPRTSNRTANKIWIVSVSRQHRTTFPARLNGLIGARVKCRGKLTGEHKAESDFGGARCPRLRFATLSDVHAATLTKAEVQALIDQKRGFKDRTWEERLAHELLNAAERHGEITPRQAREARRKLHRSRR